MFAKHKSFEIIGTKNCDDFSTDRTPSDIIWLLLVIVRFRRSSRVLISGLVAIGLYTLVALVSGKVTLDELGLGLAHSWAPAIELALAWLGLMLAYSSLADWVGTRWVAKPPTLQSFRVLQQST